MVRITPVTLDYDPRPLWFDPGKLDLVRGDAVVVSTKRGTEFGHSEGVREVDDAVVEGLGTALKPVLRKATSVDVEQHERMRQKGRDALPVFKELAATTNKSMRPVMVEFTFDGERAVFFFEAESRVDFRDLVRKLASEFHVHVDMRQIGVRDEARMVGGIGMCGQELCCRRMGCKFRPVTIRMAKEQGLSLNPEKVSGVCGRLMCCLRYEFDAYHEFNGRAPKRNATIETPEGKAKVAEVNVPKETVTVRLEGDEHKRVTFPVSAMDPPAEGRKRPNSIGEAFEEYANPDPLAQGADLGDFDTDEFTHEDKLGKAEVHYNPRRKEDDDKGEGHGRHARHRRHRSAHRDEGRGRSQGHGQGGQRPGQRSSALRRDEPPLPTHHRKSLHRHHTTGGATRDGGRDQERRKDERARKGVKQGQERSERHGQAHGMRPSRAKRQGKGGEGRERQGGQRSRQQHGQQRVQGQRHDHSRGQQHGRRPRGRSHTQGAGGAGEKGQE